MNKYLLFLAITFLAFTTSYSQSNDTRKIPKPQAEGTEALYLSDLPKEEYLVNVEGIDTTESKKHIGIKISIENISKRPIGVVIIDSGTKININTDNGKELNTKGFLIGQKMSVGFQTILTKWLAKFDNETGRGVAIYPDNFIITGSDMTLTGIEGGDVTPFKGEGTHVHFIDNIFKIEFIFENPRTNLKNIVIGKQVINLTKELEAKSKN